MENEKYIVYKTQNIGDEIWESDIIAEFDTEKEAEVFCEEHNWEYKDEEDIEYAHKLIKAAIQNADEYRTMMSESSKNWDMSRLAFMDVIIMQTALAETMTFPAIPLSVTLNEYVEIAKYYSTPKSSSFINGLLDTITKKLKSENRINK